eukprot:1037615-Prymnesium_polylepis.1
MGESHARPGRAEVCIPPSPAVTFCALPRTCGRGPSTRNNHAPELHRSTYASEQLADTHTER